MKYNEEEKFILESLEKGDMKLSTPSKKEIESIKKAASSTFKKDRRITIRLYDHDFIQMALVSPLLPPTLRPEEGSDKRGVA